MGPTIHRAAVAHLGEFLRAHDLDADEILTSAGLGVEVSAERVSRASYLEAKAAAARRLGDPHLGLRLGLATRIDALELFGAAVTHAATLRDAIELGRRAMALWEEGTEVRVEALRGGLRLHYRNLHGSPFARRIDDDQTVVFLARVAREVAAVPATEIALSMGSAAPDDASLRRRLEEIGRVRFGNDRWGFDLSREALARPLRPTHPAARRIIETEVASALHALQRGAGLRDRLHAVLRRSLQERPSVRNVAAALGLSSRSLQERLAGMGTTFATERERVREEVARELLGDPSLTVADVAARVGFASTPGFSRFVRRRTGEVASALRRSR